MSETLLMIDWWCSHIPWPNPFLCHCLLRRRNELDSIAIVTYLSLGHIDSWVSWSHFNKLSSYWLTIGITNSTLLTSITVLLLFQLQFKCLWVRLFWINFEQKITFIISKCLIRIFIKIIWSKNLYFFLQT